jgi:hypothetical protein
MCSAVRDDVSVGLITPSTPEQPFDAFRQSDDRRRNQSSSASSTLACMIRFPTSFVVFASEDVVTGFEMLGSRPVDVTSELFSAPTLPLASLAAFAAFFSLRLRFLSWEKVSSHSQRLRDDIAYFFTLMPRPNRLETIKEPNILKQVREEPQARRMCEHGDAEEYQTEDAHNEEQADDAEHGHAKVPHSLPHDERPEREKHDNED